MKRILSITLAALILAMCGTMAVDAKKKTSGKKSQAVYYVVVDSNTTLSEAIYYRNNHAACWMEGCPIYVAKDNNGVTRYRTVYSVCKTRQEAVEAKRTFDGFFNCEGNDCSWIWKSNGPAKLAAPGESHDF